MRNIVLLAPTGQVGFEVARAVSPLGRLHTLSRNEVDFADTLAVVAKVSELQPDIIINAAAWTAVDKAESEQYKAELINVIGAKNLAETCNELDAKLIHISTDFVFDGLAGPYTESDQPNPLSVYARTKVEGENIVQQLEGLRYSIVRTIIVYGKGEQLSRSNLILWAKEALEKGEPLQIVDDQFRAPTWADDLAWACVRICELNQQGIFHIAGPETLSIYQIVERVAAFYGLPMQQVSKLSSSTLQQPAKRPPHTGFILDKARTVLGYNPHTLEATFALL